MCELATAALALSVLGTGMSAYGQYQQGQQQKSQAEFAAKVSERNAAIAEDNAKVEDVQAKDALQRGADQAAQVRERTTRVNAALRANQGGSGVLTDTGTALDLLVQNTGTGQLDALTTLSNAQREAYGHEVGAWNQRAGAGTLRDQAAGYRSAGANAASSGVFSAGSTLVTGFGAAGMKAYEMGLFNGSTFSDGSPRESDGIKWKTGRNGRI